MLTAGLPELTSVKDIQYLKVQSPFSVYWSWTMPACFIQMFKESGIESFSVRRFLPRNGSGRQLSSCLAVITDLFHLQKPFGTGHNTCLVGCSPSCKWHLSKNMRHTAWWWLGQCYDQAKVLHILTLVRHFGGCVKSDFFPFIFRTLLP